MHVLRLRLLLTLGYLASCGSKEWRVSHPDTLYSWEGACILIPCHLKVVSTNEQLKNFSLYHNYSYDNVTRDFKGTVLYRMSKKREFLPQGRVHFLGNEKDDCSVKINPVYVNDSGPLGFRMISESDDKWMEHIHINISKTPFSPYIQLPQEIQESQTVTLTCRLDFNCPDYQIQFQWSLEGTQSTVTPSFIPFTSPVKSLYTESKLTFQPQWTDHRKNVTCWVKNSNQVFSEDTVRLDVKHVPKLKIEVSPSEPTVKEWEQVTMTCQVTSSNPVYKIVSWLKDGEPLKERTFTLSLPSVSKEMSGKYRCQASNDIGTGRSEEVTLTVLYAPEPSSVHIYRSPVMEGEPVELICASQASPPATNYTWYHNSKEMPGRTQEKIQIPQVFIGHAGSYSCQAQNSMGPGQIGKPAELDVTYAPKKVTMVIQNSTPIREGDSVTLFCNYNSSNPAVTRYEWRPGGFWNEPVSGMLTIQKVAWDTGPIACAACNEWCSWASPVSLNVQYAPRNVRIQKIKPQEEEIHAGHSVLLRCTFSSSQPTEVHFFWEKNGSLVAEGEALTFSLISPEDAGTYRCLVNNSIGQTWSQDWRLQVLYAPRRLRVSISPGDHVMEGRKATLICESDANPPVSHYAWFDWNNLDLHHPGQMLRLEPVKVQHSGSYRCQGTNYLGTGESPPSILTIYYSPETIGKRVALGLGFCLAFFILTIWVAKIQKKWKATQSQQGLQETSSSQSFFVRNKKARRTPVSEVPHSLGCYNPVMDESVSYAVLRFPETNAQNPGDTQASATQGSLPSNNDTVTYSVVQKRHVGDYENVILDSPEDEGIHYSELVHFGTGERPQAKKDVDYVTLKH